MFLRYFILTCLIHYVVTESIFVEEHNPDSISNELPCIVISGTCQVAGKCPQGTRVTAEGLCPYQEHRGVQCCHSSKARPATKTTCRSKGGECMEAGIQCPDIYRVRGATDCKSYETCCVLVK